MSDLPSKEELAKALAEKLASIDWFVVDDTERWEAVAGDLLDAVLPLVMRGAVEALEPSERWAGVLDEMIEMPGGKMVHSWADQNMAPLCRESVKVGELRRARTVRQWAEKIGGG